MKTHRKTGAAVELRCEACGQLPEPARTRLTLANIMAMLPIELGVHALVLHLELPYLFKVLVLTVTATVLVIWVAEPSAARLLQSWLHAPALRHRRHLSAAGALWRARITVPDTPGNLEKLTRALARQQVNILGIQVHVLSDGVLDELVLSAPEELTEQDLLAILTAGGGSAVGVWPTTALALADAQTKALSLAARVAANPEELAMAVAELLGAEIAVDGPSARDQKRPAASGIPGTLLKIPTALGPPLLFRREGEPFTPGESARAARLAELAEQSQLGGVPGTPRWR
jgi:predicted amino acid-binding ACT domain protein